MNPLSSPSVAPLAVAQRAIPPILESLAAEQAQPLSDSAHIAPGCMSDGEREIRIGQHGSLMLHFMAEWDAHGNFDDRGHAERHLMLIADLIRDRSPEQLARMTALEGVSRVVA